MKIVTLTTDYLPNIGGIAAHVHYLTEALSRQGHKIFLIHVKNGSQTGDINKEIVSENFFLYTVINNEDQSRLLRVYNRAKQILRVYKKIIEEHGKVDIVHQHDLRMCNWAMKFIKRNNVWIWTNHSSGFLKSSRNILQQYYLKFLYKDVDGIITASTERLNKTAEVFGDSSEKKFIPNGVDTNMFFPRQVDKYRNIDVNIEKDFVVLCPSRMVPVKGIIYLADAIQSIIKSAPDVKWKFIFLGSDRVFNTDDSYISKIYSTLEDYIQDGKVKMLGNLPLEDMPKVNNLADIVVLPSLMDAVSLSALEAMACKVPLVATNIDGLSEIIENEHTGLLVPPKNSEALANAILKLQKNDDLRNSLATSGYDLAVKEYSWDSIAQKTTIFYKDVLITKNEH
ncbi:glycosyltransferase family 4 protein [Halalkalibaculum sp. DA3122]|uniref:glycosyltransferase family 4 protein n=1 Tax=Halalkalibaculum sp. DA3122 TaxID=3373607 RepID=UPI0037548EA4